MSIAYLSLGSNIEPRKMNLIKAIRVLKAEAGIINKESRIYETQAWGMSSDTENFLNQVIEIDTFLSVDELMELCLRVEEEAGRVRTGKIESRIIDIDILLFDTIIMNDKIQVPHPRMQYRKFVLIPLAEIAPDLVHPVSQKTISELLKSCADTCEINMYEAKV